MLGDGTHEHFALDRLSWRRKESARLSLIQGISVAVEVSATVLFVNSDTAMIVSSAPAIR